MWVMRAISCESRQPPCSALWDTRGIVLMEGAHARSADKAHSGGGGGENHRHVLNKTIQKRTSAGQHPNPENEFIIALGGQGYSAAVKAQSHASLTQAWGGLGVCMYVCMYVC